MRKFLYIPLILLAVGTGLYFFAIPDVSRLKKENPKKTSLMEYREAEWLKKGQKRSVSHAWVPFSRISPYLAKATIIAEDDKFWSHEGFDYEAMEKALEKDIKARKFKAGGSTISQQLAKNLYLTPQKSPLRKIKEAVITWKLERALSKRRILELYLNVVEWGDGVFGAEAASRHYFGKSAMELTPMEAARLASVLPNPRRFNPALDQRYVVSRSGVIYNIMVKRGIVVPEYEEITSEPASPVDDASGIPQDVSAPPAPVTTTPPDTPEAKPAQ